jgi:hypothetical protein
LSVEAEIEGEIAGELGWGAASAEREKAKT